MSSADLVILDYIQEVTPGVTPDNGARASATLTITGQFIANETVVLGGLTYTFQSALTNVARNVKIGATAAESLLNLRAAVMRGPGAGTKYAAATVAHPTITVSSYTATTMVFRAIAGGTAGNALTSTETSTVASFGASTFAGGTNSTSTAWKRLRYTGESLNFSIENTQSAEIRPDRTQSEMVQTSASAAGDINVELSYASFDDLLQAALCGTWTSNVLVNGAVERFFTVRKTFSDMSPVQYHYFVGCMVEGFRFDVQLGQIVSGAFNLMSFGLDPVTGVQTAAIAGETFTAAPTTDPLNGVTNFQDFTIDGVPYSGCVSSIGLAVKNGVRASQCLGSLIARDMKLGTLEVTGSLELYFNEGSNFDRFVKGVEFPLAFTMQDPDGNRLLVEMPRCKYESAEVVAGSRNSDVMLNGSYRALYDATAGCVLRLTRTPA